MAISKFLLGAIAATLVASSPARSDPAKFEFFCTNQSNPALNPEGDGVEVQVVLTSKLQTFDVVHKVSGHLYYRTVQYRLLRLTQNSDGFPSYFWEGEMIKDPSVVMTGHLWKNESVWLYDERQVFKDGRPNKLATPPVMCLSPDSATTPRETDAPSPKPLTATVKETPATAASNLSCDNSEILEVAVKVYLNSTMGHIDRSIVELLLLDNVRAMGVSNNENGKKCRAQYTCDMNRAKQIEKGLFGPHPLTKYCYIVNQADESGTPLTINFSVAPDGDGGWVVNTVR